MAEATVFVVDDDEAVRDALCEVLSAEGFAVCAFASAEDFLAAGVEHQSGCLLVDIHMPGLDGLALQQDLVRRGVPLPVVVITGQGDVPKAVRALKAGAVDFIEKPFDIGQLLAAVREALDRAGRDRRHRGDRAQVEARLASLTPREREVMDLVVAGHPNKVVAARLGISSRTVENHRAKVMEKMDCATLSALIHLVLPAL
jgi:FixJ family two-component response regulator